MSKAPSPEPTARREMVMLELGRQMQVISEDASCSLWAWQLEDELPAVLRQVSASGIGGRYRCVDISPVYADWLVSLAAELGHWVMPGPGLDDVPYVPRALAGASSPDPDHVTPSDEGPAE